MTRKRLKKLLMADGFSRNRAEERSHNPNHQEAYNKYMAFRILEHRISRMFSFEPDPYDVMLKQSFKPLYRPYTISDAMIKSVSQIAHETIHSIR